MKRPALTLACLGGVLLLLMLAGLALVWPGPDTPGAETRVNIFVGLLFVGLLVYFAAIRLVLRHRLPPGSLWIVFGVAVAMRAAILPANPVLSSDIFRYVWDGKVQAQGINPYRYVPADPAVANLRDPATFRYINRATYARTIYPPAAQVVFAVVGFASQGVTGLWSITVMKLAMVLLEVLGMACMVRLLASVGLPRERVLIYAWNPLTLWAFACDGHIDAAAVGLLGVALLFRGRRRDGLGSAFLAAAALVKFIPVAVAPAFARGGSLLRPALAGTAVIVGLYALYASAGTNVLGFLSGYGAEEGLDTGSGFWLLAGLSHLVALPPVATKLYMAAVVAGYAALALWILRGRATNTLADVTMLCRDTGILAAYATAAISPHYSWYFSWMALPCIVSPVPAVVWLSSAPVLLYLDPFHDRFFWPATVYVPALGLAAWSLWRRRGPPSPAALAAPQGAI